MEAVQMVIPGTITYNVGGRPFTFSRERIEVIGAICENRLSIMASEGWENPARFLDVNPKIFEEWIDPYIRHDILPVESAIPDDQVRRTIVAAAEVLGLQSIVNHLNPSLPSIPEMAFGPGKWEECFGDIGEVPSLPEDIEAILASDCPHFPGKKVSDTHMLTLIPATVNGKPFTLNLLGELIKGPKKGPATMYDYYSKKIKDKFGDKAPEQSYWVLMTKNVLEDSRSKGHEDQLQMAGSKDNYEAPTLLEAVTTILMEYVLLGNRLFSNEPWTLTCCQEQIDGYKLVVGGFDSSGLSVSYDYCHCSYVGVASARKFC